MDSPKQQRQSPSNFNHCISQKQRLQTKDIELHKKSQDTSQWDPNTNNDGNKVAKGTLTNLIWLVTSSKMRVKNN